MTWSVMITMSYTLLALPAPCPPPSLSDLYKMQLTCNCTAYTHTHTHTHTHTWAPKNKRPYLTIQNTSRNTTHVHVQKCLVFETLCFLYSPTSCIILANMYAVRDVISLGLHTTVHPAANAGAILNDKRYNGRFHGDMSPATPAGERQV